MAHFFEKRDRWGHGLAVWVLAAMVFLIPAAAWSLKRIEMHNDVTSWLPEDDPQARILAWYQGTFPTEDRVLVSWDGSGLNDPRLQRLAARLQGSPDTDGLPQGRSPYVADVLTPSDLLDRMVKRDVAFPDAVQRLQGLLIGRGPLRMRLTDAGRNRGRFLFEELRELAHDELDVELTQIDPEDDSGWLEVPDDDIPLPEPIDGLDDYLASEPVSDLQVTWAGIHTDDKTVEQFKSLAMALRGAPSHAEPEGEPYIEECFFFAGTPAALAVTLSEAGKAEKQEAIDELRAHAEAAGIAPHALHLGGRVVAGNEINQAVKRAGWNRAAPLWDLIHRSPILTSFLTTIVFSFLLLKSLRLALLVLAVSLYTVFMTVSIVPVTGGSMNMVVVVMPTLLMVLTTSAAIHVVNYWRHAARDEAENPVVAAARMAARPCVLASLTTAIGLLSLCSSTLIPVRDFGVYSALGCLISLAVVLYGLPSLMLYWRSKPPATSEKVGAGWHSLARVLNRYQLPIVAGCLLFGVAGTAGLQNFRTETKVIRYFPPDAPIIQDYTYLEDNLSGIVPVDTVVRFDMAGQDELNFLERMEVVRRIQEKMRQHPDISGVLSLASFNPVTERPPKDAGFRVLGPYNVKARTMQRKIHQALNEREGDAEDDDEDNHSFASLIALPAEATDLAEPGDEGLNKAGDELWRITAQVAILSDLDYGELMEDLDAIASAELKLVGSPGTGHQVTGLVPVFLRTQQAVLESLIRSFGLAFGVIAVVMMILLRNPIAGLITMLPNLLPVGVVFGFISWAGLRTDIGTMITASVALGIAVDGTLHLLTWFRNYLEEGDSRERAVARALEHCGPAMLQTSAAVGIGMLTLLPTPLLLISRFGWLMAALIATALVADIILLPALLAGFLGRLIERTVRQPAEDEESEPDPSSPDNASRNVPRPHVMVDAPSSDHDSSERMRHKAS